MRVKAELAGPRKRSVPHSNRGAQDAFWAEVALATIYKWSKEREHRDMRLNWWTTPREKRSALTELDRLRTPGLIIPVALLVAKLEPGDKEPGSKQRPSTGSKQAAAAIRAFRPSWERGSSRAQAGSC